MAKTFARHARVGSVNAKGDPAEDRSGGSGSDRHAPGKLAAGYAPDQSKHGDVQVDLCTDEVSSSPQNRRGLCGPLTPPLTSVHIARDSCQRSL